ncbi:MAG: phosphomannomutase [Elusimicrobia bacterium RIFOXYB2_FULL_49_7]|nr:MAG: phosphomannomutase [Elusimicrobia bacterium RIFOXYB2_FULL_49_7]
MDPYIFREYDIRGRVGKDLTDETVDLIGKGFSVYLIERGVKRISIGGDVRLSSARFVDILCRSVTGCGIDVVQIGTIPTPVSYFSLFHLDVGGSIMVTGSHNPAEFNGFKLGVGETTIYGDEIRKVRDLIQKGVFSVGVGKIVTYDIISPYLDYLKKQFMFSKRLKIVVDAGNGAAALFVPSLLKALGHDIVELYCTVDGHFPNHHPDPTVEENLTDLKRKVVETGADIGVAYDGDADRIGVVDDEGRVLWGDYLLLLYAQDILRKTPGQKIIFEVKCSQGLVEGIEQAGGEPVMWKTGHSLLKSKMKETHAPLAGEMSGHMFFADRYFGYDDAIYATLRLMEILIREEKPLSILRRALPQYHSTPEMRVECKDDEEKFKIARQAIDYFSAHYKALTIDGVRILFGDGWGLIRASNTQPILVLRFEAKTPERLAEIRQLVIGKLKEFGNVSV